MNEFITIDLNSGSKSILKVGFLIRAVFILVFVIGAAFLGIYVLKDSFVFALVCFIISFVLFLIFFKILNAAFFKEQLIVTKEDITVIHKNLSNTKKQVFNLDTINYFGFAEQQYTKHPLDNPIVDFTGLGTQERELQYVIDEGNIKIVTGTKTTRFGKNMPSWDVEELVEKIEGFTGKHFAIPRPEITRESLFDDMEVPTDIEIEQENSNETFTQHAYNFDGVALIIEQRNDTPSSGDKVYVNGKLAPSGKYKVGDKQFVLVSNGYIYAIRGFNTETT